jgi:hypothetical protein
MLLLVPGSLSCIPRLNQLSPISKTSWPLKKLKTVPYLPRLLNGRSNTELYNLNTLHCRRSTRCLCQPMEALNRLISPCRSVMQQLWPSIRLSLLRWLNIRSNSPMLLKLTRLIPQRVLLILKPLQLNLLNSGRYTRTP